MKGIGVVAEYNPFHKGHAWHLTETRRRLGEDGAVVCVMSGNWVQRGECALTDKWIRAEMALRGGADLVLELPLPWAIASAEGFARGAVAVLRATGVVDALSFGSESGQVETLKKLAEIIDGEKYREALQRELDKGNAFAQARQSAAIALLGKEACVLKGANDSLAVEYLRAAEGTLEAVAVPRQGVFHDEEAPAQGFASATYLRKKAMEGNWAEMGPWMEENGAAYIEREGIARMGNIERAMLSRLRGMGEEEFAALPDSGAKEGLPVRLCQAAKKAGSLEEFYALAKTRRYAHARIRRLALWAFLGITAEDRPDQGPGYLRVLGMNSQGKRLLREMKKCAQLPILTKPAHIRELSVEAQAQFALECRGTDLFGLCFDKIRPCGMDYTTGPVIL